MLFRSIGGGVTTAAARTISLTKKNRPSGVGGGGASEENGVESEESFVGASEESFVSADDEWYGDDSAEGSLLPPSQRDVSEVGHVQMGSTTGVVSPLVGLSNLRTSREDERTRAASRLTFGSSLEYCGSPPPRYRCVYGPFSISPSSADFVYRIIVVCHQALHLTARLSHRSSIRRSRQSQAWTYRSPDLKTPHVVYLTHPSCHLRHSYQFRLVLGLPTQRRHHPCPNQRRISLCLAWPLRQCVPCPLFRLCRHFLLRSRNMLEGSEALKFSINDTLACSFLVLGTVFGKHTYPLSLIIVVTSTPIHFAVQVDDIFL